MVTVTGMMDPPKNTINTGICMFIPTIYAKGEPKFHEKEIN